LKEVELMVGAGKIEMNEVVGKLPRHLFDFIIDQPYNEYTEQDQAVWRYVMRQNVQFLSKNAHESYIKGLQVTGISVDSIPHMYGMNRILSEIGWAAVSVDGFIPPQAFMEFQAYNVLVIAADIRNVNHIEYTPAPDIIHEAAGHAPIIADKEYAQYLKRFGEIGSKAFSSKQDYALYEAVRHLSIIKENPRTTQAEVQKAERKLEEIQANMGEVSEMARIRNLHWWTVEYGLIGSLTDYKIYGAGLLSSRGESVNCMDDSKVKKIPYSIAAADFSFDITTEQPQLFVASSFTQLNEVLEEFANEMAFVKGGVFALNKFKESGSIGTAVLDNDLQVSGRLAKFVKQDEQAVYLSFDGPTQLCKDDKELEGHSKHYHAEGFGMPVGNLNDGSPVVGLSQAQWEARGVKLGERTSLEYASGVQVQGVVKSFFTDGEEVLLIAFDDCTVRLGEETLFDPEWGVYDLALASAVVSCYSGPADPLAFELTFDPPTEKTIKIKYTEEELAIHQLYEKVRLMRENGSGDVSEWFEKTESLTSDWLLSLELYEIAKDRGESEVADAFKERLLAKAEANADWKKMILDGLALTDGGFPLVYSQA